MKRKREKSKGLFPTSVVLLILFTLSSPAETSAQGRINALIAAPSQTLPGETVTFAVGGTGTCGSLRLAFGDGTSTTLSGAFPLTTSTFYDGGGIFTATARGTLNCTGSASTVVDVAVVFALLCLPGGVGSCLPDRPDPPLPALQVRVLGSGAGTVRGSPGNINCTTGNVQGCLDILAASTAVNLRASPTSSATFGGWGGACAGFGTSLICSLRMNSTKSVTATFTAACSYALTSAGQAFDANGGSGSVGVVAPGGCSWTASSSAAWLTITSGSAGSGNGTVFFSVAANLGTSQRVGTITVQGQVFTVTQAGTNVVSSLVNISTRGRVETGDNVMIGGFSIGGTPKTVLIRARGPSLEVAPFFVPGTLANPFIQLFSGQTVIASNDNWQDPPSCRGVSCGGAAEITATGRDPCQPNPGQAGPPPGCAQESAIIVTLPPGAYTAHVSGVGGLTGVGLVEVFEVP